MSSASFYSNLSSITGKFNRFSWPLVAKAPVSDLEHPKDYTELSQRIDVLKQVQTNLVRVTQNHFPLTLHGNNSGILMRDSINSITSSLSGTVSSVTSAGKGVLNNVGLSSPTKATFDIPRPPNSLPAPSRQGSMAAASDTPPTPYHAMAVTFANCGLEIGVEEPIGSTLYKVASIQQKIGDAKLSMDQHLATNFIQSLNVNLNTNIRYIEKARRDCDSLLNTLHVIKERYAAAGDEPGAELEFQLSTAQSNYTQALQVTTQLMSTVLESPEAVKAIAELIKAQMAYHQEAHQLLADIFPQVNEMAVTQTALQSVPPSLVSEPTSPGINEIFCSPSNSPLATPPLSPTVTAEATKATEVTETLENLTLE